MVTPSVAMSARTRSPRRRPSSTSSSLYSRTGASLPVRRDAAAARSPTCRDPERIVDVDPVRTHDEEVDVAVRPHRPARRGAEQRGVARLDGPPFDDVSHELDECGLETGDLNDRAGGEVLAVQPVRHGTSDAFGVHHALVSQATQSVTNARFGACTDEAMNLGRRERGLGPCEDHEDVAIDGRGDRHERAVQLHLENITDNRRKVKIYRENSNGRLPCLGRPRSPGEPAGIVGQRSVAVALGKEGVDHLKGSRRPRAHDGRRVPRRDRRRGRPCRRCRWPGLRAACCGECRRGAPRLGARACARTLSSSVVLGTRAYTSSQSSARAARSSVSSLSEPRHLAPLDLGDARLADAHPGCELGGGHAERVTDRPDPSAWWSFLRQCVPRLQAGVEMTSGVAAGSHGAQSIRDTR